MSGACQSDLAWPGVSQLPNLIPSFLTPFYPPNSRSQIRAEKAAVRRFICKATHRIKAEVNCSWREVPRFQVHAVPDHYSLAERQPRLGAIALDEFVDCMAIAALGIGAR